jgi:Dolichyl-phosphate-mannose-protein mannosyltransferase
VERTLTGRRAHTALAVSGLIIWAAVLWTLLRPPAIAGDWQGWRQADTQTIALRFREPGSTLLYPRIAWGGAGPGYVETELQLYPWLVARCFAEGAFVEWPGQALSLTFGMAAAWAVFVNLTRRFGGAIGLIGLTAFLSTRGVVHASTSVQPEALCLFCYVVAWFAFDRFLEGRRLHDLVVYALAGALAMLVKPTAAHLGIASFLLAWLRRSRALREPPLWIAWGAMVGVFALHLLHARSLYLLAGNTFGVLSGGDSKMPRLEHLRNPRLLFSAALPFVTWGAGMAGALAFALLVAVRKLTRELAALVVANAAWIVLTLRYSSQSMGTHYFVLAAVLGAVAVAELARLVAVDRPRRLAVLWLAPALTLMNSWWNRSRDRFPASYDAPTLAAGHLLEHFAEPGELVIARSIEPKVDSFWQTPNNFEDPRIFYLSRTRGFPVARDDSSTEQLERGAAAGARYYIEPLPPASGAEPVERWLARNAELVATSPFGGRLFRMVRRQPG